MEWLTKLVALLRPGPEPASPEKLRQTELAIRGIERKVEERRTIIEARSRLWRRRGPLG